MPEQDAQQWWHGSRCRCHLTGEDEHAGADALGRDDNLVYGRTNNP